MKYVAISESTSADHTIVAAVTGRRIRVLGFVIVAAGSTTATWKSGSTALTGAMSMVVGVPLCAPPGGNSLDAVPHFQTNAGEALVLNTGAVQVSGWLIYDVV